MDQFQNTSFAQMLQAHAAQQPQINLEIDKKRIDVLLKINTVLLQKCLLLQPYILNKSNATNPDYNQRKETYQNYLKRIHFNLTCLASINDIHSTPPNMPKKNYSIPQIVLPPPELPELNEPYKLLNQLYPEALPFFQRRMEAARQQPQQMPQMQQMQQMQQRQPQPSAQPQPQQQPPQQHQQQHQQQFQFRNQTFPQEEQHSQMNFAWNSPSDLLAPRAKQQQAPQPQHQMYSQFIQQQLNQQQQTIQMPQTMQPQQTPQQQQPQQQPVFNQYTPQDFTNFQQPQQQSFNGNMGQFETKNGSSAASAGSSTMLSPEQILASANNQQSSASLDEW
ncbi:hypothetical protein KL923_002202 [Ogataea haglerorum]|nr:hypothetical protein KL923_002202 [Ogataea haglerorum]